jgi:polyhydroxyalkanoate synthase
MSSPGNLFQQWFAAQQAMVDESIANYRRMAKLPGLWQQAQKVKKGATPSEVVYEQDRLKVLHYPGEGPPKYKTPMLFVFALVNRPYILDILPDKSVVGHFVRAGFDTYLIDWGTPIDADRHNSLDTYVNGYMADVCDFLAQRTGAPQANILGYCMGGTMSAIFTSLHQQRVRNLMLLAAGIDFSTREGLLNLWADEANFDVDAFVDAYGNCPAEFLQAAFLLLKPVGNFIDKPTSLWERADDERFVNEYLTMEAWLNDNIPLPGEIYREFVKYLYQQNRLVQDRLQVGRQTIHLKDITCPVLNLLATRDDLVPPSQSEPFTELVGSKDRKTLRLSAGHIGLAVGSKAQKDLWPQVVRWLGERSQ